MRIKFIGHSCFLIEINGVKIITDPFDESIPYKFPEKEEVDIVTVSHEHSDHNATHRVKVRKEILRHPVDKTIDGVKFLSKSFFHDEEGGRRRGKNTIFLIEGENLKLVHLGDLGHIPDEKEIEIFKNPDILMIPVGGYFTIDSEKADKVISILNPKVTIPMHYKTGRLDYPISTVDDFLKNKENVHRLETFEVEIDKSNIDNYKGIIVFPL